MYIFFKICTPARCKVIIFWVQGALFILKTVSKYQVYLHCTHLEEHVLICEER